MSYSTTLGGTTLHAPAAGPEGCTVEVEDVASTLGMADGSLVYDYTGIRKRWSLHWVGITGSDLSTIATQVQAAKSGGPVAFSPPYNSSSYTVFVLPDSFSYPTFEIGDGATYYNVSLQREEAG